MLTGGAWGAGNEAAAGGEIYYLEALTVQERRIELAQERMVQRSGANSVRGLEGAAAEAMFSTALKGIPGLLVRQAFGGHDQPRVNLRGSALNAFPSDRGVLFLRDGLPQNFVDGFFLSGELDFRVASYAEVLPGLSALEESAGSLGGVVQMVSRNGIDSSGQQISVSADSFGFGGVAGSYGRNAPYADLFAFASGSGGEGWRRESNHSRRFNFNLNAGYPIKQKWLGRSLLQVTKLAFGVPGPLNPLVAEADPRSVSPGFRGPPLRNAGPAITVDKPERVVDIYRWQQHFQRPFADGGLELAFGLAALDETFRRPVALGIEDGQRLDANARIHWRREFSSDSGLRRIDLDLRSQWGERSRKVSHNVRSERGELYADNLLSAVHLASGFNAQFGWGTHKLIEVGLHLDYTSREVQERYPTDDPLRPTVFIAPAPPPPPTQNFQNTPVSGFMDSRDALLRVAMRRDWGAGWHSFAQFGMLSEAPVFDDLLQTSGGTPNAGPNRLQFVQLATQRARAFETGFRWLGPAAEFTLTAYANRLHHEILTTTDSGGNSVVRNAETPTWHTGIEMHAQLQPFRGQRLSLLYDWRPYHFENDPVWQNNRLPGVPEHYFRLAWESALSRHWSGEVEVEGVPESYWVDYANTFRAGSYTLINFKLSYRQPEWTAFLAMENAADVTYAASTMIRARVPDNLKEAQTNLLPGYGRSLRAGVTWTW